MITGSDLYLKGVDLFLKRQEAIETLSCSQRCRSKVRLGKGRSALQASRRLSKNLFRFVASPAEGFPIACGSPTCFIQDSRLSLRLEHRGLWIHLARGHQKASETNLWRWIVQSPQTSCTKFLASPPLRITSLSRREEI